MDNAEWFLPRPTTDDFTPSSPGQIYSGQRQMILLFMGNRPRPGKVKATPNLPEVSTCLHSSVGASYDLKQLFD